MCGFDLFVLLWCGVGLLIYNVVGFSFFDLSWWCGSWVVVFAFWVLFGGAIFDFAVVFVGGWVISGAKVVEVGRFCYKTYLFAIKPIFLI